MFVLVQGQFWKFGCFSVRVLCVFMCVCALLRASLLIRNGKFENREMTCPQFDTAS